MRYRDDVWKVTSLLWERFCERGQFGESPESPIFVQFQGLSGANLFWHCSL